MGCDLDYGVIEQCSYEYSELIKKKKLALVHSNYANIPLLDVGKAFTRKVATKSKFDIALMDLGFSNYQLHDENRGFSYMADN